MAASMMEEWSLRKQAQTYYTERYERFRTFCEREELPHRTPEELDIALLEFMGVLYLEGCQVEAGSKVFAAVRFYHPECVRRGRCPVARTFRGLRGFQKAAPNFSRFGLPYEWVTVGLRSGRVRHTPRRP